jgi:hypothetical protein
MSAINVPVITKPPLLVIHVPFCRPEAQKKSGVPWSEMHVSGQLDTRVATVRPRRVVTVRWYFCCYQPLRVRASLGKTAGRGQAALLLALWMAQTSGLFAQSATPLAAAKPAYTHPPARLYLKKLASPEAAFRSATGAAIDQAMDTPKEWGAGGLGYGRRFGSAYAEHIVRETLMFGSSSALHEDNHNIRSGETGFGRRLKYALESSVLARRDDDTRQLSISKIGSTLGASFIWRMWQPPGTNSVGDAMENFGVAMGVSAGFDVAREFLPDLFDRKRGSD